MKGVGLAREKMSNETEQQLSDYSSMKQLRMEANCVPGIREDMLDPVA